MIVQLPLNNEQVMVVFRLPAQIWADSIHLVGDFNNWSTTATPMRRGEQYWEATVTVPAGSTCYYAYLVDGKYWCSEYNGARHARDSGAPRVAMIPIEIAQADELALTG
ncbi:MAG: isoamylase early set domain-containing protein [Chloroflexaceae bacterium]|nr:isoamylase early set domain-containing protein [Chloroflexaceae bacterium]